MKTDVFATAWQHITVALAHFLDVVNIKSIFLLYILKMQDVFTLVAEILSQQNIKPQELISLSTNLTLYIKANTLRTHMNALNNWVKLFQGLERSLTGVEQRLSLTFTWNTGGCTLSMILMWWKFMPCYLKILPRVVEICSRTKMWMWPFKANMRHDQEVCIPNTLYSLSEW